MRYAGAMTVMSRPRSWRFRHPHARAKRACAQLAARMVQGPALRAVVAGGLGPVQRTLALAPVEAAEMTAAEGHPHDTLAVDIGAARSKAGQWDVVDLGERR